jgi:hypothetical protein
MSKQSYSDKPEATIPPIQRGRYQHYKGQFYEVIDVAHHSETQEPLVLYRALYGARGLWVRPYSMFFENIKIEGSLVPRFAFLGEEE